MGKIMPPEEAFPGQPKELVTLKNGLVIQKIDSIYILQGDIILTEKQVEICNNEFRRSAVVSSGINRWTDNTSIIPLHQALKIKI